jgi:hypothetical protein
MKKMKTLLYKLALIIGISFSTVLLNSCSKDDENNSTTVTGSANAQYFSNNVLNRDLTVQQAFSGSTDITASFSGYTFRLTKNAAYSGTITASNDLLAENGTWSIDADYSNLTFTFPTDMIPDLAFFNKQWQFSSRASAVVELTSGSDVLKFQRK